MLTFCFEARIWRHEGAAAWHFLTVPEDVSDEIADVATGPPRGFGAVRVEVSIGRITWRTSVFPDAKAGAYVLPVKKAVRTAEDVRAGDSVTLRLTLVDSDDPRARRARSRG